MRRYTPDEEQRVRLQAEVREWSRAGLLDAAAAQRLEGELRTDLKRTNHLLRAAIALFTLLIVGASVALVFVTFSMNSETAFGVTLALGGVVSFALADLVVGRGRVYRYGVEEALAVSAVGMLGVGTLALVNGYRLPGHADTIAALIVSAGAAFVVYRRFGFMYAGVGALICAGIIPFQVDWRDSFQHIGAAAVFVAAFLAARALHRKHGDDFPGDEYAALAAAACAASYLAMNLHLPRVLGTRLWSSYAPYSGVFYWATYAATWIIPAAALVDAIRAKDRLLLRVAAALALLTLATNKPYLGWPRQAWDPMVFGLLLAGVSLALRRWLAGGPDGRRSGYTAARILRGDTDLLEAGAQVSVAWQDRVHQPPSAPVESSATFAGGRSGGAGGGASY